MLNNLIYLNKKYIWVFYLKCWHSPSFIEFQQLSRTPLYGTQIELKFSHQDNLMLKQFLMQLIERMEVTIQLIMVNLVKIDMLSYSNLEPTILM